MSKKIIAVVGAPGSGKSFLVKKMEEYYSATAFLEGEEVDLPKQIIQSIQKKHY